ncbi:hypothetical protein Mapa_008223 [Marchantia paleacea]|nr:hypothetical protein Mapa_008223 [Marchantia paleacea]
MTQIPWAPLVASALGLQVLGVVPLELVHGKISPDLVLCHLRVVDAQKSLVSKKSVAYIDSRSFSGVTSVFLECESENGDLLSGHGVEHGRHNAPDEASLLVVIDLHYLLPVIGHLHEPVALTDVHQVQNVLLEARSSESDTGVQKLGPNSRVLADGVGHLRHIGPGGLAQGGHGIDGRDPLRQEGIGGELRQLRGPQVGGQDVLLRHPVRVHGLESGHGLLAFGSLAASDQDAVGLLQILDGGTLGQKLRVRQDLEVDPLVVVRQNLLNCLRGLHRHGGFLHHNLVRLGDVGNHTRCALPVGQICGLTSSETAGLSGRVDGHENNVGLSHQPLDLGAEEQIFASARLHDLI